MSFGCGGKPAGQSKNRMIPELSNFAARLLPLLRDTARQAPDNEFNELALELFALQFKYNSAYRIICEAQRRTPEVVEHWTQIPAVPATSFKELDLTCLASDERTAVFHSSGTTEQKPSRHYHSAESLAVYEASLWKWFEQSVFANSKLKIQNSKLICLTPPPTQAPHSSLVHMFETIRQKLGVAESVFVGELTTDGAWALDFEAALAALNSSLVTRQSSLLLGTAFSFVHLLDFLGEKNLRFDLPAGSRVMETGGYKNHSRTMPKDELHALITERLGVPQSHIVCEYGMSELSSQAYDRTIQVDDLNLPHPGPLPKERGNGSQPTGESEMFRNSKGRTLLFPLPEGEGQGEGKRAVKTHCFHFPPWARVQIISPETNREVTAGETGLIRVFDLANAFSVMAIQTEDLGVRRGDGFELFGRARFTEPRGCSLMSIGSK
jgi:Acyl-protein synthetase, LuxE